MFIVFAFNRYYPAGGAADIQGTYKSLNKAKKAARHCKDGTKGQHRYDYVEIYDTKADTVIMDYWPGSTTTFKD